MSRVLPVLIQSIPINFKGDSPASPVLFWRERKTEWLRFQLQTVNQGYEAAHRHGASARPFVSLFSLFLKLNQVIKQQFRNVQENSDNEL